MAGDRPVRATHMMLMGFCLWTSAVQAQSAPELGSPEAAFSAEAPRAAKPATGRARPEALPPGPIRLSKNAAALLRAHYQGDKVPLIPQPFRARLDAALMAGDWPKVEAVKKELIAARGLVMALAWEQSRFLATGGTGIAELHARDIAATNSTGVAETAAMLWLYAVAVTMTDGHKCASPAARDTHLEKLRGPAFEPLIRIVRALPDARVAAMRDLAIQLENRLSVDRIDDSMCRADDGDSGVKPDSAWRPEASRTRGMLPKHLTAFTAITRPRQTVSGPEKPVPPAARTGGPRVGDPKAGDPKVGDPRAGDPRGNGPRTSVATPPAEAASPATQPVLPPAGR